MIPTDDRRGSPAPGFAYGSGVAARLRACTRSGPLAGADAAGEAGSLECGSLVRIELRIRGGLIEEARYQAHGCPATLAAASQACEHVNGRPFLEAASLSEERISRDIGLVPEKEYTAGIVVDALHEALTAALASSTCEAATTPAKRGGYPDSDEASVGMLVGMSGGVDSAVTALLMRQAGHRLVGLTLRFWNDPRVADERSCCSPENVRRARRVAHSLGIPHVAVDARDVFYDEVVQYFVAEYAAARTPNPCAKCNSRVRLGLLVDVGRRLGLSAVATGHYARFAGDPPRLLRGVDETKDQSYVLAEVAPEILEHFVFPLGAMRKPHVRRLAVEAGLEGHSAPESQEICFVPDDDHQRFLRERLGDLPGDIVDTSGRARGRHGGTYGYTIGQRKGLGIAAAEPLYVVALDASERRVIVGTAAEGRVGTVRVAGLTWHRDTGSGPYTIQVRSSGLPLPVAGLEISAGYLDARLTQPASGVAPGQTAVVYDGDRVIVAGTIQSTGSWHE